MSPRMLLTNFTCIAMFTLAASAAADRYDFFGNDISGPAGAQTALACAQACNDNPNCRAWTFVKPGRMGPTARCFLKNPVPAPAFNSICPTNNECVSGLRRSDGWCGETPARAIAGSQIMGQGEVLTCPAGQSCRPRITGGGAKICWALFFPYPCHGEKVQSTDFFCQP
jgi:hypothetical protein